MAKTKTLIRLSWKANEIVCANLMEVSQSAYESFIKANKLEIQPRYIDPKKASDYNLSVKGETVGLPTDKAVKEEAPVEDNQEESFVGKAMKNVLGKGKKKSKK